MNKTLHKKLTGKHLYAYMPLPAYTEYGSSRARAEKNILEEVAQDLLQPRAEAIAYILKMSRNL
jgi:hypothetical protein